MKAQSILFIHPTRGRPHLAYDSAYRCIGAMTSNIPFRYVFSLDADDPHLGEYRGTLAALTFRHEVVVGENASVVPAVNRASAELKNEDLIINIADDFGYRAGWDERLIKFISVIDHPEYLVHVTDLPNGGHVAIIQIISSALYRRWGYFFYPGYISMYADQDMLEHAQHDGVSQVYSGESLGFEHLHPAFGRGQWDETYARENRSDATSSGAWMLQQRRQIGFKYMSTLGFQDDRELARIIEIFKTLTPRRRILEIGSAVGDTLLRWLEFAEPGAQVISIDMLLPLGDGRRDTQIRGHLLDWPHYAMDRGHWLYALDDDSHRPELVKIIHKLLPTIDFFFIDGDHSYEGCKADYDNYAPLVRPGGIIAIHDVHGDAQPGVVKFWNEVKEGKKWEIIQFSELNNYGIGIIRV